VTFLDDLAHFSVKFTIKPAGLLLSFKPGFRYNTRYSKAMPMRLRFRHATVQRRFREDGLITMSNASGSCVGSENSRHAPPSETS